MLFGETIVNDFNADFIASGMSLSSQSGSSGGILVDIYTNNFARFNFWSYHRHLYKPTQTFFLSPYAVNQVVKNETGFNLVDFLNQ